MTQGKDNVAPEDDYGAVSVSDPVTEAEEFSLPSMPL